MMGVPNLIADNMDCGLSYSVIAYLKKLSQQVIQGSSLGILVQPIMGLHKCVIIMKNRGLNIERSTWV